MEHFRAVAFANCCLFWVLLSVRTFRFSEHKNYKDKRWGGFRFGAWLEQDVLRARF